MYSDSIVTWQVVRYSFGLKKHVNLSVCVVTNDQHRQLRERSKTQTFPPPHMYSVTINKDFCHLKFTQCDFINLRGGTTLR